uniref:Venom allergen 5 n=1 Tax=Lycosa singoriensis TaxID=434756 RepID=VA5_LYCSI|nr:RecName: Full=Venom allergen 5; AltName: Full=Antigen 5; Flags: Precursor [Lycosa singoriensis]ABX75373.1 venom allergen [Lycosa singoriensis]
MSAPVGIPSLLLALCALLCVLNAVRSAYCPDPYKRYSDQHSYCVGVCCSCAKYRRGVSPWLKKELVRLHNNLRSKVAGGKSHSVDHLPRATNMLEMVWDDELAEVAQRWSDKCERKSDCEDCRRVGRFGVGQIIFEFDGKMDGKDMENEFFSRFMALQSFRKEQVARFTAGTNPKTAQILWAKTWRIGCGFLDFNYPGNGRRYTQIVCNYGPKGNEEGEEVYKAGSVCSSCPANTCCGDACKKHNLKANYHGLCKVIDENLPPEGNVPHKKTGNEVFYCGFNDESDCRHTVEGVDRWIRNVTTGGTWLNTYLGNYGHTVIEVRSAHHLQVRQAMPGHQDPQWTHGGRTTLSVPAVRGFGGGRQILNLTHLPPCRR